MKKFPSKYVPRILGVTLAASKEKQEQTKKRSTQLLVEQWYGIKVSEDEADAIGIGRHLVTFIQKNTEMTNWEI